VPKQYVIIGNGAAGLSAAEEIRRQDNHAYITIVSDEPFPFYSRPGLAYYLRGDLPEKQLYSRPEGHYEQQRFHRITARATQLDLSTRRITLSDGRALPYDALLIATGSHAVKPNLPGIDLPGVIALDTMTDVHTIMRLAKKARRAVVVGGGITALELVEGLQAQGVETHYLLRKGRFWSSLLSEDESDLVEDRLIEHGIKIHRFEELAEVIGQRGRVKGVRTKSGRTLPCDIVGMAIGVRPNIAVVKGPDIKTDRGILVDDHLQTNIEGVYAAGDVAQVLDRWSGQYKLDVLWPTALATGKVAGANMAGIHKHYRKAPPFNAALLCGLHMTTIGQVSTRPMVDEETDLVALSRGTSEVWFSPAGGQYASVVRRIPGESQRLVMQGPRIIGALLLGDQTLADPLRGLIAAEADITSIRERLLSDHQTPLADILGPFWENYQKSQAGRDKARVATQVGSVPD